MSQLKQTCTNQEALSRINQISDQLNFIKQKIKSQEIHKSSIQQKLNFYDSKIGVLTHERTNRIHQNQNDFDYLLNNSNTFRDYLKKSDNNTIINLKKIQDYINNHVNTMYTKFSTVQQKIINLFQQKQKIIQHISYQIDNQTVSIRALQQWIKINQAQNRSLNLYQDNMNQRFQTLSKQFDLKVKTLQNQTSLIKTERQIIENKIQYFDQILKNKNIGIPQYQNKQQSKIEFNKRKSSVDFSLIQDKFNEKIDNMHDKLQQFNRQLKKITTKINLLNSSTKNTSQYTAVKSKNLSQYKSQEEEHQIQDIKKRLDAIQQQMQYEIKSKTLKQQKSIQNLQKQLKKCNKDITKIKQTVQSLKQKIEEIQQSIQKQKYNNQKNNNKFDKSNYDSIKRPSNNIINNQQSKPFGFHNDYDQYQQNNQYSNLSKAKDFRQEKLPTNTKSNNNNNRFQRHNAKLNIHQQDNQLTQTGMSQMRGGIRGLLKKSKEKDQNTSSSLNKLKNNKGSSLNPLKKPLPPKKNPLTPMKKIYGLQHNRNPHQIYQQEEQDSDDMYQIDQQGFLIDSQGRYLTNQFGQRMQLSNQDINQILRQQGN